MAQSFTVTILSGQSQSAAIGVYPYTIVGIDMPAGWDAAALTFLVGTHPVIDVSAAAELSVTVSAGQYLKLDPVTLYGIPSFIVRSGTNALAVNQTADRVITLYGVIV